MDQLERLIAKHEGLRLKPYRCSAGKLTIGYGRNIEDVGISEEEAIILLNNDVTRVWAEATKWKWFNALDPVRKAVVLDMLFNLGTFRFGGFKKFIAALERRDFEDAAKEMLDSKWAQQVGTRAARLHRMMRTGQWPEDV